MMPDLIGLSKYIFHSMDYHAYNPYLVWSTGISVLDPFHSPVVDLSLLSISPGRPRVDIADQRHPVSVGHPWRNTDLEPVGRGCSCDARSGAGSTTETLEQKDSHGG